MICGASNLVIDFSCCILSSYCFFFLNKKSEGQNELISLDNVQVLQFTNVTDPKQKVLITIQVHFHFGILYLSRFNSW
jgi:hypothetical protein